MHAHMHARTHTHTCFLKTRMYDVCALMALYLHQFTHTHRQTQRVSVHFWSARIEEKVWGTNLEQRDVEDTQSIIARHATKETSTEQYKEKSNKWLQITLWSCYMKKVVASAPSQVPEKAVWIHYVYSNACLPFQIDSGLISVAAQCLFPGDSTNTATELVLTGGQILYR